MSEKLELLRIDISERTVFSWKCPKCDYENDTEIEPYYDSTVDCDNCRENIKVIDD